MGNPTNGIVNQALSLLAVTPPRWRTCTGTFSLRLNVPVLTSIQQQIFPLSAEENDAVVPERLDYSIWATAEPWQVRMQLLRRDTTPSSGSPLIPETTIFTKKRWLRVRNHEEMMGWMPPDEVLISPVDGARTLVYGDEEVLGDVDTNHVPSASGLESLLRPSSIPQAFIFTRAEHGRQNDRETIDVEARLNDDNPWGARELAVLGADRYTFRIDVLSGIVVKFCAHIEDSFGCCWCLSDVELDVPLGAGLFATD